MLLQSIYAHLFPNRMEKERDAAVLAGQRGVAAETGEGGVSPTVPFPVPFRGGQGAQPIFQPSPTNFQGLGAALGRSGTSALSAADEELTVGQTNVSDRLTTPTPPTTPDTTTPERTPTPSGLGIPRIDRPTEETLTKDNRSPLDKALAKEAELRQMIANPEDKDRGFKQRALELAQNFLYGLSQTQPGMSKKEALILGATGAGAGAVNRTFNEQRQAQSELPFAVENVRREQEKEVYAGQKEAARQKAEIEQQQVENQRAKILTDAAEKQDARSYDALKETLKLPNYDRANPAHRAIVRRAGGDPDKVPEYDTRVEQILTDGTRVKVSGEKALEADALRQYRNAQFEFEAGKFNADQWGEYQKNLVKWADGEAKRKTQINSLRTKAESLEKQAAEAEANAKTFGDAEDVRTYDPKESARYKSTAVKLRAESEALKKQIETFTPETLPPPPKGQSVKPPVLKQGEARKIVTQDQLAEMAAEMGWDVDKMRRAVIASGAEIR